MDIALDGKWEFYWRESDTADSFQGLIPEGKWLEAQVPGDVHLDLMKNGLMEEPLNGLGTFDSEKIENRVWFYRKIFDFDAPSKKYIARLLFEGLDCLTEISLNGVIIGKTENAFVPHYFDVSDILKRKDNCLLVKISNGLETVSIEDVTKYGGKDKADLRIWLRKPQFSFKWDWAPRLITCGIWRSVKLEVTTAGYVDDIYVLPILSKDLKNAKINTSFSFKTAGTSLNTNAELKILHEGKIVSTKTIMVENGINVHEFQIENPALWYPEGEGKQNLYRLDITLSGTNEKHSTVFGVRRIRLLQKQIKEGGKTFVLEVNARKIFCKGANWVPADSIVARVDDIKTERLIREAVNCNFNMLRVWGGGVYESKKFYELCDESGIMIWQDFMYACALYPDDDEKFFSNCAEETEKIIKQLRNHPSIVVWCGNNEIHDGYEDVYSVLVPKFYGGQLWDNAIPKLLHSLIPGAIYRPASPYGGAFHRSDQEGDCHSMICGLNDDDTTDIRIGTSAIGRMMVEFYCWNSPPDIVSMKKYLADKDLSLESPVYLHHCNDVFKRQELGVAKRYITEFPEKLPLEIYIEAMQRLHGEHMGELLNSYRRNIKICSGALFWMYNDSWPTSGWTTHDYYLRRKALFYYMKRAFAPVSISMKDEEGGVSVWISNLSNKTVTGVLDYGRYLFTDGKPRISFEKNVTIKHGTSIRAGFFYTSRSWPWEALASFASARLKDEHGTTVSRTTKFFSSYKGLSGEGFSFPPSCWESKSLRKPKIEIAADNKKIIVTTDVPAFSIKIDAEDFIPDDNFFDLLPGEEKILYCESRLPEYPLPASSLNDIILNIKDFSGKTSCQDIQA